MANKKLEIKASEDQINTLQDTLKAGAPLQLALQRAGISLATYYYWIAIASIVKRYKSTKEIEEIEKLAASGVDVSYVRELAQADAAQKKTGIGVFVEPSAESLLRYKNSRKFRQFADQCYDIVDKCDKARSDFASLQLIKIAQSTNKKNNVNPSGAMWWLERNMPDYFAKPSDKAKDEESPAAAVPSISVEFIDPGTPDQTQRLLDMEERILNDMKKGGSDNAN